jgi:TrmH family RNA methyltransferase
MQLSSPHNPILKSIRRASKEGRPADCGCIVIEGPHLLAEALQTNSKWSVERIFTAPPGRQTHQDLLRTAQAEITEVSTRAFRSISGTETTQELIALARPARWSWADLISRAGVILVLDGVQDPGNAGTLIRSAEAFGAAGVILLEGCARISNGKLLRATAGSIFRTPFLECVSRLEFAAESTRNHLSLYALAAKGDFVLRQADFTRPCALVVGSEGQGIAREILANAQTLAIPTLRVESLNAAVAGSIALFEAARQRGAA